MLICTFYLCTLLAKIFRECIFYQIQKMCFFSSLKLPIKGDFDFAAIDTQSGPGKYTLGYYNRSGTLSPTRLHLIIR